MIFAANDVGGSPQSAGLPCLFTAKILLVPAVSVGQLDWRVDFRSDARGTLRRYVTSRVRARLFGLLARGARGILTIRPGVMALASSKTPCAYSSRASCWRHVTSP